MPYTLEELQVLNKSKQTLQQATMKILTHLDIPDILRYPEPCLEVKEFQNEIRYLLRELAHHKLWPNMDNEIQNACLMQHVKEGDSITFRHGGSILEGTCHLLVHQEKRMAVALPDNESGPAIYIGLDFEAVVSYKPAPKGE